MGASSSIASAATYSGLASSSISSGVPYSESASSSISCATEVINFVENQRDREKNNRNDNVYYNYIIINLKNKI